MLHRFNGKHTLNLCIAKVFKTKNSEISSSKVMVTKQYLLNLTDRYIQFILQPVPGFKGSTHILVIPTFHI